MAANLEKMEGTTASPATDNPSSSAAPLKEEAATLPTDAPSASPKKQEEDKHAEEKKENEKESSGPSTAPSADPATRTLFTVGHSTRTVAELAALLAEHGVKTLVDVRTGPHSRTNPQHNKENLEVELPRGFNIGYVWLGQRLGGLRKKNKELGDMNTGWHNTSFQGYADHMQSAEFGAGLVQLMEVVRSTAERSGGGGTCIMCAEVVHWHCHRGLLCDALVARGWYVQHITNAGKPTLPHQLAKFAKVEGEGGDIRITYPPYSEKDDGKGKQRRIDSFFGGKASAKRKQPEKEGNAG